MRSAAINLIATAAVALSLHGAAIGQVQRPMVASSGLCGPLENAFGPFDYRTATYDQKHIVEGAHFTPAVETLRSGSRGSIGADIDYTLRVFPNHPRALFAMTRLGERYGGQRPPGARYPVECYYDRAIRFQPDDSSVRVLYAIFLIDRKRPEEARSHLSRAEQGADDPQVAYNLGLAYFDLREFDRSLEFAHVAYKAGIAVPGLRAKLTRAGKWKDPE